MKKILKNILTLNDPLLFQNINNLHDDIVIFTPSYYLSKYHIGAVLKVFTSVDEHKKTPGVGYSLKHGVRGCSKVLRCIFINFGIPMGWFWIVPGILMTPYFCDGITMGCFADENNNNGSSFQ